MSNPVIKHQKELTIPDGADTTVARPSDWNADHAITQNTGRMLGRVASGSGPTQELTAEQSRTLMGLGTAALVNVGTASGEVPTNGDLSAAGTPFDDTTAQLGETDVQGAIDALAVGYDALAVGYRLRGARVVITTSQTYTPDEEVRAILVELIGGGGGGGGQTSGDRTSPGGGGGGYAKKFIANPAPTAIGIGAGGNGGGDTVGNLTGQDGGTTTFGTIFSATGGAGAGQGDAAGTVGGGAGIGVDGDINVRGQNGYPGGPNNTSAYLGAGGNAALGYGQGGPSQLRGATGQPAQGYGGGGGGGHTGSATARGGGDGTDGIAIIWEFI